MERFLTFSLLAVLDQSIFFLNLGIVQFPEFWDSWNVLLWSYISFLFIVFIISFKEKILFVFLLLIFLKQKFALLNFLLLELILNSLLNQLSLFRFTHFWTLQFDTVIKRHHVFRVLVSTIQSLDSVDKYHVLILT